ncbi:MAG: glycosyltransferase family 2 protein [Candidatus Pacebacteria bacterium]|nr:glycosyltransferase family 2 protein [Candidatus Paceibacterota bacterium]PIR60438.1 MAG: glycosyltransferase family 2 protein [Candidatus Pacebacteria bacterium CG10_big_fil_rev_8_21_14_0_10_45_6]
MKHISIIIVNFNQQKLTDACLLSLTKVQAKNFEFSVFVVDNGSSETYRLPTKLPSKQFFLLRSDANLGFTGGNNLGIHTAIEQFDSEYVLLLNNDTVVDPGFLSELFEFSEARPRMGIVSAKIFFSPGREFHVQSYTAQERGNVLWYAGGSVDWDHLVAHHRGVDEIDRLQFAQQELSDFATGCCALVRREVLEKAGFLDRRYFLYLEDVDLSMRARLFGYQIGYCDTAKVWHVNASSSGGSGSQFHLYYQLRNRLFFFSLYGTWRVRLRVLKVLLQRALHGSRLEHKAIWHFLTLQDGKQPII